MLGTESQQQSMGQADEELNDKNSRDTMCSWKGELGAIHSRPSSPALPAGESPINRFAGTVEEVSETEEQQAAPLSRRRRRTRARPQEELSSDKYRISTEMHSTVVLEELMRGIQLQ